MGNVIKLGIFITKIWTKISIRYHFLSSIASNFEEIDWNSNQTKEEWIIKWYSSILPRGNMIHYERKEYFDHSFVLLQFTWSMKNIETKEGIFTRITLFDEYFIIMMNPGVKKNHLSWKWILPLECVWALIWKGNLGTWLGILSYFSQTLYFHYRTFTNILSVFSIIYFSSYRNRNK